MPPLVSVIITTRNERANIGSCLSSIKKQTYNQEDIEIIVVDNNSTDETKDIARQYTDNVYNFGPDRSAQLNFGVKLAKGLYILFPDADMILSKEILSECVKKCETEGIDGLYTPERVVGKGFWIKVRDFERSFYDASCIDCVRFIKRDIFLSIGAFDESLDFGPDDWDFDRRVRRLYKVNITKSPIYHNEKEFNLRRYLKKKAYYVKSFDKYIKKWGKDDSIVRKQLGFWYRYFGVYLENGKWKKLIIHPLLTFGLYFLRFLVGVQYIKVNKTKNKSIT